MAEKKPLILYSGKVKELQSDDSLPVAAHHHDAAVLNAVDDAPSVLSDHFQIYGKAPTSDTLKLLVLGNGEDDGTVFTDEMGNTLNTYGTVVTKTGQKKEGTASIYFNGTGGLYITDSADFNVGDGDFTWEFWIYRTQASNTCAPLSQYNGTMTDSTMAMWIQAADNKIGFAFSYNGTSWANDPDYGCTIAVTLNTWHHVALVRNGASLTIYVDGAVDKTWNVGSNSLHNSGQNILIGYNHNPNYVIGYMDCICFHKGLAKYTEAFTPPTVYNTTTDPELRCMFPDGTDVDIRDAATLDGNASDDFAAADHDHDSDYSAIDHNHDSDYLAIDGTAADSDGLESHGADYFATADHTHGAGAEAGVITVTQASHGFAAKDVIRRDDAGSYVKAQADTAENCEACGIVASVDGNDFTFCQKGHMITGLSGFTDAGVYFLSEETAGLLTLTEPTTGYRKVMARAHSTSAIEVVNDPAFEIAESPTAAINYLDFAEGSAPATPGSGIDRIYFKTDGKPYYKDDAGNEVCLMSSSLKTEVLTGSGNWTCPAGVYLIEIYACAGGGSGGSGVNSTNGGAGGGGGAACSGITLSVIPEENYAYSVGAGGAAPVYNNNGNNGNNTTFGILLNLEGGKGGAKSGGSGGSGGSVLQCSGSGNALAGLSGGAGNNSGTGLTLSAGLSPNGFFPGAGGAGGSSDASKYGGNCFASGGIGNTTNYGGGGGASRFGKGGSATDGAGEAGECGGGGAGGAWAGSSVGGAGGDGLMIIKYIQP